MELFGTQIQSLSLITVKVLARLSFGPIATSRPHLPTMDTINAIYKRLYMGFFPSNMAIIIVLGLTILSCVSFSIPCSYYQPQWTGAAFWNMRYQMGYDQGKE